MRTRRQRIGAGSQLVLAWTSVVHLGCSGASDATSPETSSIRVVVESTGPSLDPNGYTLMIDGTWIRSVDANGTLTHPVNAGNHDVRISEISSNCTLDGTPVRVVPVERDSVAEVRFEFRCTNPSGSVAVRLSTDHPERAPGGHRLVFDGRDTVAVGVTDSLEFRGLPDGTHSVEFIGGTPFCYVVEPVTRSVGVSGTPVLVELLVTCAAAPAGEILVDRNQAIERISPEAGTAEIAVVSGVGGRWSPDRSRIVYSSTGESGSRVAVLTLGTAASVDLGEGKDPSWSPDGQRITFVRSDGLYVIDADGSDARLVVELSGIANPVWSPDGSFIAFARTEPGRCSISILLVPCATNLHLVRPDGAGLIKLTTDGGRQPAWSPSGSHLVFVRGGGFFGPPPRLVRLDVTARVEQTVWSGGIGASSPVWSPDGAYLAFQVSMPGATSDVLLLPLAGGRSVFLHQPGATPTSWH